MLARLPDGTPVVFAGGRTRHPSEADALTFANNVWKALDKVRDRFPDMVLIHGGDTKGVDRIASSWAERRNIPQVTFSLDMRLGARAGFKRNERMLSLSPRYVVAFPGTAQLRDLDRCASAGPALASPDQRREVRLSSWIWTDQPSDPQHEEDKPHDRYAENHGRIGRASG